MVLTGSPGAETRDDASLIVASHVFDCSQCKAKFSRRAHLKRHQKSHQLEKPFSCLYCNLSSSRKDVIARHTRNFHPTQARTSSNDNSLSHSSLSPRRSTPTQEQSETNGTTSDTEHRWMSDLGSSLSRDFYANSAAYESFDDPSSGENRFLALDAPSEITTADAFDIWTNGQFADPAMSQVAEADILLLPAACTTTASHDHEQSRIPSFQASRAPNSTLSIANYPSESRGAFHIENEEYETIKRNYEALSTSERDCSLRFPSKYAVSRFVRSFFEYMDPHMPIIHLPTFDIMSTAAPLLVEIMACGALYAKESTAAQSLHMVALLCMRKYAESALFHDKDTRGQLWRLQTSLLVYYFDAFQGNSHAQGQSMQVLSQVMNLAHEAIQEMNLSETPTTYRKWVLHETLNRCLSATVVISAAYFLDSPDRYSLLGIHRARFRLPSPASMWSKHENCWQSPKETLYSTDVVNLVLAGCKLPSQESEFGFATIVSAVVCHICAFETLFGAQHPDLFHAFVEKMDKPFEVLKNAWKERSSTKFLIESSLSHMAHTTRSMILSTSFHLYGSQQLRTMRALLKSPAPLDWASLDVALNICHTARLEKSLIMAAEMLRSDCQTGLGYIQSVGFHKFAPLSVGAPFEASLLLSWYIWSKKSGRSLYIAVDKLISDAMSEANGWVDLHHDSLEIFPLELYARLFDSSLWKCLDYVCERLRRLKQQLIAASTGMAGFEYVETSGTG